MNYSPLTHWIYLEFDRSESQVKRESKIIKKAGEEWEKKKFLDLNNNTEYLKKNMEFQFTLDNIIIDKKFHTVSSVIKYINKKIYKEAEEKFSKGDFYYLIETDFHHIKHSGKSVKGLRVKIKVIKLDVKKCKDCFIIDTIYENNVNEEVVPCNYLMERHEKGGGFKAKCYTCNKKNVTCMPYRK